MALDETAQRVLTVFRSPARLGIFSMADGRTVSLLETCGDADDVFADSKRHRVYVACGSGALDVFDAGGSYYRRIARIPTVAGARTALFIAELDKLVLAGARHIVGAGLALAVPSRSLRGPISSSAPCSSSRPAPTA